MGGVSADGKVLWLSGRYNAVVYAISTRDRAAAGADPGRHRPARPVRLAAARALLARAHRHPALTCAAYVPLRAKSPVPARRRRRLPQPRLVRRVPASRSSPSTSAGSASWNASRSTSSPGGSTGLLEDVRVRARRVRRRRPGGDRAAAERHRRRERAARSLELGPATRCSRPTTSTARCGTSGRTPASGPARRGSSSRSPCRAADSRRGGVVGGDAAHARAFSQPHHLADRDPLPGRGALPPRAATQASSASSTAPTGRGSSTLTSRRSARTSTRGTATSGCARPRAAASCGRGRSSATSSGRT